MKLGYITALVALGAVLGMHASVNGIELMDLPYGESDLEPYISAETIEFHYGKHHAAYVSNLNGFIEADSSLEGLTAKEIMLVTTGTVFNNAAQVYNHDFYWNSISPSGGGKPSGPIKRAILDAYGSFETFQDAFDTSASGHFGSGWAWLVQNADGSVTVVDTHDASNPIAEGLGTPILTCDVWEHAYYIDYRNGRGDYIDSWWNLVNWDFANENFDKTLRN